MTSCTRGSYIWSCTVSDDCFCGYSNSNIQVSDSVTLFKEIITTDIMRLDVSNE